MLPAQQQRVPAIGLLVLWWLWGLSASAAAPDAYSAEWKSVRAMARAGRLNEALARLDAVIDNLPAEDRTLAWTCGVGKWFSPGRRFDRTICVQSSVGDGLQWLEAQTGRPLGVPGLEKLRASRSVWMAPGRKPEEILLGVPNTMVLVDATRNKATTLPELSVDPRIRPLWHRGDLVFFEGHRSRTIVRTTAEGKTLWRCSLPGYVMTHPAAYGPLVVVQTRGSSYGGQATTCVDLDTGKKLWSETVDAYGRGAAFGDDAYLYATHAGGELLMFRTAKIVR